MRLSGVIAVDRISDPISNDAKVTDPVFERRKKRCRKQRDIGPANPRGGEEGQHGQRDGDNVCHEIRSSPGSGPAPDEEAAGPPGV